MKVQKDKIERSTRVIVSKLLRIGVLTAAIVTLFGGILFFIQHPNTLFSYHTFNSEPARLRYVSIIIREAFLLKSRAIIQFGILILIATPVLRVIFSLIGYLIEKDWIFVFITGVVMTILLFSLFVI